MPPLDLSTDCLLLDKNEHKDLVDAFNLVVAVMESLDGPQLKRSYMLHVAWQWEF